MRRREFVILIGSVAAVNGRTEYRPKSDDHGLMTGWPWQISLPSSQYSAC
jgi:hypothetical protein